MDPIIPKILQVILILAIQITVVIVYVVMAIQNRQYFKKYWKPGLFLAILLFFMVLPSSIFSLVYIDALVFSEEMRPAFLIGLAVGFFILIIRIGWHMILYFVAAAEWEQAGSTVFAMEQAQRGLPRREMIEAFSFGICAAVLTYAVFIPLGVQEGPIFAKFRDFFPAADSASLLVTIPIVTLFVTAFAISEELVFRGGILGLVVRRTGENRVIRYIAISAISLLWALAHIPNTSVPEVKVVQVFIIGLILAEIARRSCIQSAIAAHIGLNLGSVGLTFVLI
ncbi:MAG: CPBP family intramembrane metalloprotease [Planctomycetota bacterium]|nr:MAG: CPBP family intramembrane metalloprotease [Planctomycetota bacterium]